MIFSCGGFIMSPSFWHTHPSQGAALPSTGTEHVIAIAHVIARHEQHTGKSLE